MKIKKLYGVKGARIATGIVVVVDIFRAGTVEACALSKDARHIFPVSTKEEAFALKEKNPQFLLVGEQDGYKIPGFNFGNSPSQILNANLKGKVLIHRSTEGTQGLVNAINADELIFGSFVTLSAIKNYIKKTRPQTLSIVAMGNAEAEDGIFANFLKEELDEKKPDITKVKEYLTSFDGLNWYFDESMPDFPKEDFDICMDLNRFDFFCKVENKNGRLTTTKG